MKHITLDEKSKYVRDSLILLYCPNASHALRKCENAKCKEIEVELNKLNGRSINGARLNFDLSELELSRMII